jgi:hypothetical protein
VRILTDPKYASQTLAELKVRGAKVLSDVRTKGAPMLADFENRIGKDPKMATRMLAGVGVLLIVLIILVGLDLGARMTAKTVSRITTPTATPTAPGISGPIELSGPGLGKTAPFYLTGNVRMEYNVVNKCAYYGNLKRVDGAAYVEGIDMVTATAPAQGAKQLRKVPAGQYYFEMIAGAATGCVWYVTFRPAA